MAEALAAVLPIAVGIVLVPLPIAAVIVLLFSPRATANGLAFVAGWVLGFVVVGGLTLLIEDGGDVAGGGEPAQWASAVKLVLGGGLLFLAYRSFRKRPRAGEVPSPPAWMATLAGSSPTRAFGYGALLSGANPKNVLLTVTAMTSVALLGLSAGEAAVVLAAFVAICSVGVTIPVVFALVGGQTARETLRSWETWLVANNAVVVAVVFLVLGSWILSASLAELVG